MSIGEWFKRFFSSPASTDAPAGVAAATDDEKTIDEARLDAGAGLSFGSGEASEAAAEDIASEEAPPDLDP